MSIIYEPRGKAREYSPLAVNLYSGCGHKCSYCYVPSVLKISRNEFDNNVYPRKNIIELLKKDAKKYHNTDKQVLMSFTTDPYNFLNDKLNLTKKALEIFYENKIPTAILTKNGLGPINDEDIISKFGEHIKIGCTLTCMNKTDSKKIEPSASLPNDRLDMLNYFNSKGINTWISFEPIIYPQQVLDVIKKSMVFVDEYQFGLLSGDKRNIDWNMFLESALNLLRKNYKKIYVKKTLRNAAFEIELFKNECDENYLNVKPFEKDILF